MITSSPTPGIVVSPEVRDALGRHAPVVALESTIFSNLGLPAPQNADALHRCIAAIRDEGAVPAITAVLNGEPRVGLDESEHQLILGPARKVGERELALAVAQRWDFGATTVSASLDVRLVLSTNGLLVLLLGISPARSWLCVPTRLCVCWRSDFLTTAP